MTTKPLKFLLIATLSAFAMTGCMFSMKPPTNLDYGRIRSSQAGLYRAAIKPDGDSIPIGKLQKWTLHVDAANGASVQAANIEIRGGMPQHGHGLPTKPQVTRELGDGNYLIEGMKFNMGGWWELRFRVRSVIGVDTLVFNVKL
ncbi:MAG: FixH family protein [Gemmatimonadaceae bacterium]